MEKLLLIFLLYFSEVFSEKGIDVQESLKYMVHNFSYAINLSISNDYEIYQQAMQQFPKILHQYCHAIDPSLLCDVIQGSLKLTSRAIKENLARGHKNTLSMEAIQKMIPWKENLLEICLKECQLNVNEKSCDGLTPLEYSIKTQQYKSSLLLVNYKAQLTSKAFYYTISNQNKIFLSYLLSHTSNYSNINNELLLLELASIYHWLGFDYGITKLLNIQLSSINSYQLIDASIFASTKDSTCTVSESNIHKFGRTTYIDFNTSGYPIHVAAAYAGWLVYEDHPRLGLPGCHLTQISAKDLDMFKFQQLINLRSVKIILSQVCSRIYWWANIMVRLISHAPSNSISERNI